MKVTIELRIDPEDRQEFLVDFAKFFEHNELPMVLHKLNVDGYEMSLVSLRKYLPEEK
jgi:hypothetical protein